MPVPQDWYRDENSLLSTLKNSPGLGLRPPSIAGYDGLRELGRGGQGVVYSATQRSTKRTVAIKVLLEGAFASPTTRYRFEREVDLVAALRHPNIVQVYDSGVTPDGRPYFVMEYIEGASLDELIRPAAREPGAVAPDPSTPTTPPSVPFPSIDATLGLFAKICEAVNYAHQRGVIHRDLKPSNIRIDPSGEPHALGPNHPDTVTAVNNAARLAQEQGQYEPAEALYQQAIAATPTVP